MAASDSTENLGPRARHLGRINTKKLKEISGLAVSQQNPGILWVHDDGDADSVYAIRTSGEVVARVQIPVAVNDLEDMAIGAGPQKQGDYLFLGDIGDNAHGRKSIQIVAIPEPSIAADTRDLCVPYLELFSLTYPDAQHDAETLLLDPISEMLLVITKEKSGAQVFGVPMNPLVSSHSGVLQLLGHVELDRVSGGDISRDGSRVILRREDFGWVWHRKLGEDLMTTFSRHPQEVAVRGKNQGKNGESVGFSPDGSVYYTLSEGKNEVVCEFQLDAH